MVIAEGSTGLVGVVGAVLGSDVARLSWALRTSRFDCVVNRAGRLPH